MLRLLVVLHAHLPWVREPDLADFLEEDWFHEARFESYLPLVGMLDDWVRDGITARLTVSLSPPLCEMLVDPLLAQRFELRLERLIRWAHDAARASGGQERVALRFHYDRFVRIAALWAKYHGKRIVEALVRLSDAGVVELITTAATHAFLPLWRVSPRFIDLQVGLGSAAFRRWTGRTTRGFWLPECGFAPGLDGHLARHGFAYTFLDTHGLRLANPRPHADVYRPVVGAAGAFAFARDPATSAAVWSAEAGYPGDPRYREFYRDLGRDQPRPEFGGTARAVGIKPYAITGRDVPQGRKLPYARASALRAVRAHAADFVARRIAQSQRLDEGGLSSPVVVAPFDAELFGHWWFEGPEFLDAVARSAAEASVVELVTAGDVLAPGVTVEQVEWAPSSWGRGGYAGVWLAPQTASIWPRLHAATRRFFALFDRVLGTGSLADRIMVQLARELLLAASSDWPFLITEGGNVGYAQERIEAHLARFDLLAEALEGGSPVSRERLAAIERQDAFLGWLTAAELRTAVFAAGRSES